MQASESTKSGQKRDLAGRNRRAGAALVDAASAPLQQPARRPRGPRAPSAGGGPIRGAADGRAACAAASSSAVRRRFWPLALP